MLGDLTERIVQVVTPLGVVAGFDTLRAKNNLEAVLEALVVGFKRVALVEVLDPVSVDLDLVDFDMSSVCLVLLFFVVLFDVCCSFVFSLLVLFVIVFSQCRSVIRLVIIIVVILGVGLGHTRPVGLLVQFDLARNLPDKLGFESAFNLFSKQILFFS